MLETNPKAIPSYTRDHHDHADHQGDLDRASLCAVRGGNSWLSRGIGNVGPLANVTVNVNQNIAQLQSVNVNTLNPCSGQDRGRGLLT